MFILNNKVTIYKNRVVTHQKTGTPGVYKVFNVKPNIKYIIYLKGYSDPFNNTKLWIADMNNIKIYYKNIDLNNIEYNNKNYYKIKIGILFSGIFKIKDYFMIDDIKIYIENLNQYEDTYYQFKSKLIINKIKIKKDRIENNHQMEDNKNKEKIEIRIENKLINPQKDISMTNMALVTNGLVIQLYTSQSIKYFESFAKRKYKLISYHDKNIPTIFYGCYNDMDLYKIKNHKGPKALIWGGSDIMRSNMKSAASKIKNLKHIAQSTFIINDLKKIKKSCIYLPFSPTVDYNKYIPNKKGNFVYIYTNATNHEFYGSNIYRMLIKQMPKINFIVASNHMALQDAMRMGMNCQNIKSFRPEEMHNVYKKCFIGLRLTRHDGISATVQELGLMGIKTIHNGKTPSCINYSSYNDIMKIIINEMSEINTIDYEISNKVKKHLELCDELLPYLFKTIYIQGYIYNLINYDMWTCHDRYIKKKDTKWVIYNALTKIEIYENTNIDTCIPPIDNWIEIKNVIPIITYNNIRIKSELDSKICVIIYTYNNRKGLINLLNDIKLNFKQIDVYIYDNNSGVGVVYDKNKYKFNIYYHRFDKYHNRAKMWDLYKYIMEELKDKNYDYYYCINDDNRLVNNFFNRSINLYESINDINKIILNLKNNMRGVPRKIWMRFNPIKYNNNIWLTNWLEIGCFMFKEDFFKLFDSKSINNYDINRYITSILFKENKHIYLVTRTLVIFRNNLIKLV